MSVQQFQVEAAKESANTIITQIRHYEEVE